MRRVLLAADLIGLVVSFLVLELLFPLRATALSSASGTYLALLAAIPIWIVLARLYALYEQDEERTHHPTSDDLLRVFHLVTVGVWFGYAATWLTGLGHPGADKTLALCAIATATITGSRTAGRAVVRRSGLYLQNTVVVGAGTVGQRLARKMLRHPEYGFTLIGFVDDNPLERQEGLDGVELLGGLSELPSIVCRHGVERVIVAFSNDRPEHTLEVVRSLNDLDVQIAIVPRLFELVGPSVQIDELEGMPLVELPPLRLSRSSRAIKRTIDIAGACAGLLLTAPLFAYISIRVKLDSRGPVFFRQTRLGQAQAEFTALKFRTMYVGADQDAHRAYVARTISPDLAPQENGLYKLERPDEITPFGRWLRKTSLDELPQLINVLRGDMSLVGPRPCIRYETEFFLPHHFERFMVPAGITGLWQTTARGRSTFGEALDMDVAYARGWSLELDLRLLVRTPFQLLTTRRATT